ncbi:DUF4011 domain-containing protein [Rhodococcus opacus]|uniref:DUF4011 domain-containing protein n=1 Tax=Rhodococcus opacus TaxID=37919 RepID=UPI001FF61C7F|nr:DUF4011 domain-containing protein [Rhodococcus opacus]UOT04493.1 DUF4011 domain-containing protein [Rhodococcus opacus]
MTTEPVWDVTTAGDSGLTVEVLAQPAINLALVHNSVPLLSSLRVTNNSGVSIVDLTVTMGLHGNGEELVPPWTQTFDGDLPDKGVASWDDFRDFVPSTPYLRALNESHPATITVTVSRLWGADIHVTAPIKVLAHNEWFNAPVFFDSLAAFVQPNTASVRSVLDGASDLLLAQTGDSSLGGYQGGTERAALTAAAVYESLRSRGIRYINPPASFERTGQKVRTTAQVLDEQFGTCIDLAVTYAACLEATGLHPLIFLTTEHAFAGFLREDKKLTHASVTEQNALVNLVESGIAVPVEAIFYDDSPNGDFGSAVATAKRHFAAPHTLDGVIGVSTARKDGILPLPTADAIAPAQVSEPTPLTDRKLSLPAELLSRDSDRDAVLDPTDTSPARVRKWKRSLLDLSTRNRLLNLKSSAQVVDLHVPTAGLPLLDDLIHSGKSITLAPNDGLSSIHQLQGARQAADIEPELLLSYLSKDRQVFAAVTRSSYARRFKELGRTARTLLEETGSSNLYLTLGALIHHTSTGREARAPLFLLPVRITGGTGRSPFQIVVDTSEVATPNYCLVEWLRLKHNVSIDALEKPKLDQSGLDITEALRGIRAALVENDLDLRIDELATISICQFGTFGMWKDLTDHWDVLERSPIVRHLTHNAGESFRDPHVTGDLGLDDIDVDETSVPVPIPADGSQLRAVALAAAGRTFVLEGPPGTGKSQTITNLIAHALDHGKTVLFVAEKQAALDVVKKRLGKVGLADFTLDLHGKSQSPREIREQLKIAIDNASRYNQNAWTAKLADFRSRYGPLADYPAKIHDRNGAEQSLWTSYEDILTVGDGVAAPIPANYVANPGESFSTIADALGQFSRAAQSIEVRSGSPWSIAGEIPDGAARDQIPSVAVRLAQAFDAARSVSRVWALLTRIDDPSVLASLLPQAKRQLGRPVPDGATLAWMRGPQFAATRESLIAEIGRLQQYCAPLLSTFTPLFVESGDVQPLITEADESGKGLFGKKKKLEQFQKNIAPFANPDVDLTPDTVLPLLRAIPTAREHIARIQGLAHSLLGPFAPPVWNPLVPGSARELDPVIDYVSATVAFADGMPELWHLLESVGFPTGPDTEILEEVADAWSQWRGCLGTTRDDDARWRHGEHWLAAWERDTATWTEEVEHSAGKRFLGWSRMSAFLAPLRRAGLSEFVDLLLSGGISSYDAEVAFLRGAARASMTERRNANGLTNFDTALRDGEIDDFVRAANAMRAEQVRALPAALLRRRPFQAGALKGEVGELRRLLDRKRGGATFRNLMSRYAEHILAATPCVFVSPASLAQFVPPGSATFDLVVFDEASQVTVPQAIGALGRGRSAIIVGDSQQMPPTSFGQVTAADDDEADEEGELAPEDLDSILTECVESGVPRLWLSWHYRSQDESLINFSNQKYYEGRLASLPSPGGDSTAGVEWRRLHGHFNREDKKTEFRTNRVEAEAIVDEIRMRLSTPHLAGQSIGVVTFNTQQRTLVQDLLDECEDPLVREQLRPETEEGIFVKNLENVQGDERDVILFTTAFSKKPSEPKLPLNFGPLSRSGGEKRFNVAVTRARRKVVVFTSFDPSDIDLSRTRSVGLAHLRGYLEMADQGTEAGHSRSSTDDDVVGAGVCAALEARGYEVEANYGLSEFVLDIVVREPGADHWQVAVLLDGPQWAERPTVSDRDLTPQLLESLMNWGAYLRVWLPDWIDHPDTVLTRVDAAVECAKERRRLFEEKLEAAAAARAAEIAEAEARAAAEVDTLSAARATDVTEPDLEWGSTFEVGVADAPTDTPRLVAKAAVATDPDLDITIDPPRVAERDWNGRGVLYATAPITPLGGRDDLDRVNSATVRRVITDAARETVDAEGPVELGRLARDVARRFGFDRVSAARKDFVISCVPAELIHTDPLGSFVWPRQIDSITWRGYRTTPDDVTRPLNDIAPEEILNAMNAVCTGRELDTEAVMRETMAVFNQKRLAGPSRDRLEACLDLGVRNGRLIRVGTLYRAGS